MNFNVARPLYIDTGGVVHPYVPIFFVFFIVCVGEFADVSVLREDIVLALRALFIAEETGPRKTERLAN